MSPNFVVESTYTISKSTFHKNFQDEPKNIVRSFHDDAAAARDESSERDRKNSTLQHQHK